MNMKGPSNSRYKTMMCKHFNTEEGCQYGEKCQFAHGATDLRVIQNQMGQQEFGNSGGGGGGERGNRNNQQKSMMNYKIVKCKNFEKEGQCKYNNHCTFAHGDNELRSKTDSMMGGMGMGMGMGMGGNPQQNPMMPYQQYMYDYMMANQMPMGNMQGMGGFPQMPMDYSQGTDPNAYMMMNMPQEMNLNNMNLNNPMPGTISKGEQSNQK